MRPSSRVFLPSLSALGAVLLLGACNERAPEKAEGVASPAAQSSQPAQPPATTASPDTMSPANPPPGDGVPAPTPPTLPQDPDAAPTPLPTDPTDPTRPPPPPHSG